MHFMLNKALGKNIAEVVVVNNSQECSDSVLQVDIDDDDDDDDVPAKIVVTRSTYTVYHRRQAHPVVRVLREKNPLEFPSYVEKEAYIFESQE